MALLTSINTYYNYDSSNSNDSVGSNNGTDTAITYSSGNAKLGANGAGFNGTTSKQTFASMFSGTGDFTIAMWIKTSTASDMPLWTKRDTATGNGICKFGINATGNIYFWDYNGASFQFNPGTVSTGDVNDGNWHLVGFTRVGTAGTYWVDGATSGTTTAASNLSWNTNTSAIGYGGAGSPTEFFNGSIDEPAIWSQALSSTDWTNLYNSGAGLAYPFSGGGSPTYRRLSLLGVGN